MDWFELVGQMFPIHGVRHICIAESEDALLMLQYGDDGSPCQYVVAHGPYKSGGELCWLNGAYFPFFDYESTADALLAAGDALRPREV